MEPPQSLISCQTMLVDHMGSLLLITLVVKALRFRVPSTLKSLVVRRLKRVAWFGARQERADFV